MALSLANPSSLANPCYRVSQLVYKKIIPIDLWINYSWKRREASGYSVSISIFQKQWNCTFIRILCVGRGPFVGEMFTRINCGHKKLNLICKVLLQCQLFDKGKICEAINIFIRFAELTPPLIISNLLLSTRDSFTPRYFKVAAFEYPVRLDMKIGLEINLLIFRSRDRATCK